MKYLLCGINAKYIHSNLAVHCLEAYAKKVNSVRDYPGMEIEIREYTINHYMEDILRDLYEAGADVIIFSCYLWNISLVEELVCELHKVAPDTEFWVGGPEVSYSGEQFLAEHPEVSIVMQGEGEDLFADLVRWKEAGGDRELLRGRRGLAVRCPGQEGRIWSRGLAPEMDLNQVPFVYEDFRAFENKILYYETSRGCPYCCSYCLSSVDEKVRFRSLDLVIPELDRFIEAKVPQVKFVDRTFNCNKKHAMGIWSYIQEHDNGITNFHFEIAADLLDEDEMDLFARMRPGLIQLEIGVQSTNEPTIDAIRRRMDLNRLFSNVDRIRSMGNIHQHLDLIAGLPCETYEQFGKSFDDLFAHRPDQLQLGFLKVLKGTYMEEQAGKYEIRYLSRAPYEVLSTHCLSYDDLLRLKGIEEMTELYYNSGQYTCTLAYAIPHMDRPFHFFEGLADWYYRAGYHKMNHNRLEKYRILKSFLEEKLPGLPFLKEVMLFDLYLREKVKSRPDWAPDQSRERRYFREMYRLHGKVLFPDAGKDYDSRKAANKNHMEHFPFDPERLVREGKPVGEDSYCLFDYGHRDPLNRNARIFLWKYADYSLEYPQEIS